ncbi:hypothetical protein QOL99_02935 [Deinococcus sp. MIMF12]|uniref:DUF4351 domain-containing protein n=1 Tax=Deinococcus rhizophilus TaxID=3049544 RepID=A0ABT7JF34_9DEIO|nr:hypothetical protein [Deinococcus rhizophilus]MDL2343100.1 hypothetical protein [Deinococcus rhizophilus]
MTRGKVRRVAALEARRREWEAAHVPLSDLPGFLFAVLSAVEAEAGADAAGQIAGRIVEEKAARVHALLSGLNAAQLGDVARRVGLPLPDFAGLSAADLARLYFDPATWGQA